MLGRTPTRNRAEQAKERRKIGQSSEDAEETFQFGDFQLTSFLIYIRRFSDPNQLGW